MALPALRRVLILGGTGEARQLADLLAADPGLDVTTSLAGATTGPRQPAGRVITGGLGGAAGLARLLRAERFDALIDATHPFAATVSANAAEAAAGLHLPLLVLRRPGWQPVPGDRWHRVATVQNAAALLPALGSRVLLTTGRRHLAPFTARPGVFLLVRSVEPPEPAPPANCRVLLARGPFGLDEERELLREHRIDVLVTRDSGGAATAAKLTAAREAALPVIVVRRPEPPSGVPVAADPEAAAAWLRDAN
jgi:precorrin-6A/cobalt-precorrin-6A reductase